MMHRHHVPETTTPVTALLSALREAAASVHCMHGIHDAEQLLVAAQRQLSSLAL